MKNKILPIALGAVAVIALIYFLTSASDSESTGVMATAKKGKFVVDITTTGELEAKNSVQILGPQGTRNYRIWNMTIQDIIDEGTFVRKGDYVAQLDPTELTNKIKDSQLEMEKIESQFIQTKLDTTLEMRKSRDELINLNYAVDEMQLKLDQSQYEPPATIRQAEIDLTKAKRAYEQAKENYKIKREQNIAKMQEVTLNKQKEQRNLDGMMALMQSFTITAPEDGMLIYKKDWNGQSVGKGSQISAWDPVVATLPDLSTMISITYVNEVDIRKVKEGQQVELGLDAFPEKKLSGDVIKVANVGEQRPNSDAKIFQVNIVLNERDDLLKPSMTTSNQIITDTQEEVLHIPIEGLFNQDDSITYVFKKSGLSVEKQEVMVGATNTNEVVILAGLNEGDQVFLNRIPDMDDDKVNLIAEMDGKRNEKKKTIEEEEITAKDQKEGRGGKRGKGGKRPSGK
ncbi:efflux RND transporter periplasmic adaptor subunit [Cryomorphaceae bacterium 1068]|nr:efflux RND transporter periplasmic adaptor subunit [Cryomorphaceae bacterium 1068]